MAEDGGYEEDAGQNGGGARRGPPGTRVYVGNLSWDATWQDLKDHMRGPNQDLSVAHVDILQESSGRSKGCAVVEYSTPEDAQRAIAELNDSDMLGRLVFVREDREDSGGGGGGGRGRGRSAPFRGNSYGGGAPFRGGRGGGGRGGGGGGGPRPSRGGGGGGPRPPAGEGGVVGDGRRLYVGNLSWSCTWQDLKDHMRAAGEVVRANVLQGPDGRSKGCGLVEFATVEEARRAIAELNDTELAGRMIFVREDREAA